MNKYIIGVILAIVIVVIGIMLFSGGILSSKASMVVGKEKISLDVADTDKKREIGLSTKKALSDKQGMLFVFPSADYPAFWMKGMSFPIDIIFVNDNKIITIYKNVPAPKTKTETPTETFSPTTPSNRVVELKAGSADRLKLKTGDTVDISL